MRSYGFKKLSRFLDSLGIFEVHTISGQDGSAKAVLVRTLPTPEPPVRKSRTSRRKK